MSDNAPDDLDFSDIEVRKLPVRVGSKSYILQEASGFAATRYQNAMLDCTQFGPDGKPASMRGMADVDPLLVSLCLVEEVNGRFRPVPLDEIRKWPSRIVKAIAAKAKEISELNEEDDVEALEKQKAEIEEKLTKLREGAPSKNVPDDSADGFDSPPIFNFR